MQYSCLLLFLFVFFYSLISTGGKADVVQLAVASGILAAVANSTQDSQWTFWHRRPLLFCLPQDSPFLQPFSHINDWAIFSASTGNLPPVTLKLYRSVWFGIADWRGESSQ